MHRTLAIVLLLALIAVPGSSVLGAFPMPDNPPPVTQALVAPSLDPSVSCAYSDTVNDLLAEVSQNQWVGWIRKLSGADPVTVAGQTYTITSRYSPALFYDNPPYNRSRAIDYIHEVLSTQFFYPESAIEEDSYKPYSGQSQIWKNLILTIPGTVNPEQVVILSAHLDSTNDSGDPYTSAPGADDNATGSATLLEAARVLKDHPLPRTIRIIWFTGEEQGMLGSKAYVEDHSLSGVLGDINLDMFGYDGDNDKCFELHVGNMAASAIPGTCFTQSITNYNIDVIYDYLTTSALSASDHSSFWAKNIGALEVLENYQTNGLPGGCGTRDFSPYYHRSTDTIDRITLPFSYNVARAGLATVFSLALPPPPPPQYLYYLSLVMN